MASLFWKACILATSLALFVSVSHAQIAVRVEQGDVVGTALDGPNGVTIMRFYVRLHVNQKWSIFVGIIFSSTTPRHFLLLFTVRGDPFSLTNMQIFSCYIGHTFCCSSSWKFAMEAATGAPSVYQ